MNKIKTRDKNFIRKGERGSVTLFVLIAMMFFLTVGVGVYMANVNTQQAQQKGVKKVQLEYSSTDNIDNIYKDQVEKLGQKLIIVVKDSENKIYQEGTWTNKLPLTIIANWPDGTKESEKEVSLTSPSKVAKKYSFDKENTALILNNEDNNIENGKWTAQVEVAGKKQSVEIWIDTTAPTCTITSNPDKNPTNADSITFTLKNEDLFSGLVSDIDYSKLENIITVTDKNNNKLENGSDVTWDWIENENNKVKFTINKDDFEGNIKITIPAGTLTDNAGNTSEEITKEVKIDKKAPTCIITANPDKNPTNASSIVYTFKWSEEVTGFTTEDITVTNGTKGIFTAKSATEYTLAVTTQANQNNTQTINVAAGKCTDIAGNGNIAVNKEVKIDRVTPTCTITANPDKSPTNASSITYTFTWSEEVTGFTTEDITVTNGTKGTFTKTSGTVYTLVVTTQANQDNTQTINVAAGKCKDIAGNENAAISKEVKIDRKSPTCTITANPNTSPTNASSITYTFTWSEEVTGFTTEDITVTNGTKGTFTKTSGTVYTLVVTTAAKQDNTQKVVINTNVCTDVVGNGNIATSKEVKIDRKAPTATSCEVKNITATGYDVYVYGVTDSTGVDRVLFPTWTQNNGQDDIQANWWETTNDTAKGENLGNGTWHYRVNVTDHKNEYGTYTTHVYTYDTLGNKQICSSTNIEVPAVNITYLSDNLVYGLENRSSTTDHNMTYSISNGVVTVTANASDGWGNTTGRVYLEANTQYEFTCTTSGTWGNSVEAFLLLNGSTSTYIRMDSNNNYRFTPAQSGTYYIRLDVNTSGKTYTFSNIEVRKIVLTENKNYGLTLTTLPDYSRTGYTFNGWFTAKTGGTKIATTTPVPGANTTYYAQTKANTYTVKYDGNGATSGSTASSSHTYNVAKALTANGFAKTGYTFNGWNTKADGTGTSYANSASVINLTSTNGATVTLYAQWKINQYNIDLNYNVDGTTYWSGYQGRIKAGLKIGGVDKGYVADYGGSSNYGISWEIYGLQLDGVNVAYTQKGTLGASNLNLLVYFYTISFKADSATYGSVSASSVIVPKNNTTYSTSDKTFKLSDGRTVTASTKSVTGYTSNFTGWSSTTGTITSATSITAKFSGTLITYTIGYTLNGGTVSGNPTSYNITTNTITLKNPTRTGYTFAGWTGSNGTTKQTTVTIPKGSTGNKTYTANWTANNYKILFDSNGGTGTMASISTQYGKDTTLTANAFSKKYTVKYSTNGGNAVSDSVANQLFMGWTLGGKNMYEFTNLRNVSNTTINSDGTLTINKSNTTSSTIWSNLFFKSNSEIEANTNYVAILDVKSKTNTGSSSYYPSSDNGTDTAQIASASTVSINNIGIGRNYINIKSKSTTTGHSNLTRSFWAIYANASLNIKFRPILVKGTYSNIPLYYYNSGVAKNLTSTNNGSVTLYADWGQPTITLPTPTRTGYTFAGWYSDSGLTSKIGNGGSTYRPAKDITLYAKWTANTYTVKYDGNGATSGSTVSSSHTYNVAKALTANGFARTGYTFNGWNTKADGTGTSYANSASVINLTSTNGATITLYAQWTANTYTITYDNNYLNNTIITNSTDISAYTAYQTSIKSRESTQDTGVGCGAITELTLSSATSGGVYKGCDKLTSGTTYTWSVYVKASSAKTLNIGQEQNGRKSVNVTTNWQRITHTFVANSNTYTAFIFYLSSGSWADGDKLYIHSLEIAQTNSLNISTQSKTYDTTLGTLPAPIRTGYTFAGWYTAPTGGTKIETTTAVPAANTTYYAHWTTNKYYLDLNGKINGTNASGINGSGKANVYINGKQVGTNVTDYYMQWPYGSVYKVVTTANTGYTIASGATLTGIIKGNVDARPAINSVVYTINLNNQSATTAGTTAIYEKYNVGIYKESACTNKMTTTANAITKPERKYTVTFNYNGSGKANTTGTATWTFGGYYTATAGSGTQMINASGNVTDNLTSTKYTATATLYANWTGGTVSLPTPTRTGYTFAGWYTAASGGTKIESTSKFTSAQTLYAHWTTKNYTLKIDPNGGTLNNSTAVTTSTVAYGATKAPGTPTRTGYTFAGWVPTKTEGTDNATWVEVFYHNNNFGSTLFASDEEALSSNTRDKYSILNKLESFRANTSSAFEFLLKYDELGSAYNRWKQTSNPTTSTTISGYSAVAISWTANSWGGLVKNSGNTFIDGSPSATTWFYAIGAKAKWDIGIPGPSSPGITQGTSLWVKANSDLSNIEKFITGVVDSNGNYIVRHDVTLKAVWIPNVYAINLNNQSATSAGTTAIYEKYNVGIYKEGACTNKMTTTANAITKPERKYTVTFNYNGSGKANTTGTATWTFGGYYTATAGSGTQMINASGNVTDNLTSTKYTATATLYANWTGGTVSLPTPTRTGYTFAGWYTAASGGNKIESTSKITSAQTLYAHWTDTTAPTVTFGTNRNTTYAKSQSTTVTVTDSGSGVNTSSLKYQWTQSTTAPAESTFSTTFTSGKAITKNTGTGSNWYLWILAKDNAGNKTIKRSNAFYLDNTAPTASVSPTAPVAKNKVTITLKDAHSKVKYWAVTTSTTAPTTTSTTITTNTSTLNTWYPVTAATQVSTTFTPGTTSKYYVWVKDSVGNGATAYAATFTPTPANYEISKSGATTYYETTLANATANAVTGSTIKVLNSVTESTAATIEEGKSLTINTNQKTITMNNCNIKNNGSLVVKGQGTIKCSTGKREGSVIFSTGNLTIGSVTIVNTVGEGIYAGGTMNMSAGTVTGKTAGIEVTGTTTITGGTVSATGSNEGAIEPGGLRGNATININGGTITGDYGVCQGGQRVETAKVIVNIGATSGDVNGGPVVKGNKNAIGMSHGGTVNFYQGKLQGGTERVSTIPFSAIRSGYMVYLDNTSSTTVHTISLKPTSFGTAVAMINNINYYTIQAAIECCGTYETTIEQINDITSGSIIAQTAKDHNIIWTKKVGNYTSKVNATGTMVVNNGKLTMKLIYIEIKGGTASPIITNNGDLTLYGGSYYNNVNSASIINNQGSGNVTTKEAAKIYGNGYGIYSSSLGTVSVTSLSKISGGTYGIYSSSVSGGKIVVNQGCVEGITFGIYTKGSCDITFGTLGTEYNNISGIQAMGTSNTSVNITGDQGQIINSNGIAIETSGASVNIDDKNATIQGKTYGIKTFSGNITVKKGIVKATGTAAPGILTRSGSVTLGVNDGTVSTTIPAITGNGNAAIVKEDPKTGTMAVYDGRLKGSAPVISASAAGPANYEQNGGTIIKPTGYSLNIALSLAILKK